MQVENQNGTGRVFHIWNRGVDGRKIFLDENDHKRFLLSIRLFNSSEEVWIREYQQNPENPEVALREHQPLVAFIAHTELDNHFHLCVKEVQPHGLTIFLRKLGTGYTKYFNKKHDRRGRLFESRTNYKPVETDQYLQHLISYIHLNVLDRHTKEWRDGKMTDWMWAQRELLQYPWSSARHYLEPTNRDSTINQMALQALFDTSFFSSHLDYLKQWSQRGFLTSDFPEVALREHSRISNGTF